MKAVKTSLEQAENIKKYLIKKNLNNREYQVKKEKNALIFPIKSENDILKLFPDAIIIDMKLEKKSKIKNYKEFLKLPKKERDLLPSSYDIIGNIIIVEIKDDLIKYERKIGTALLETHPPVKTILKKKDIHAGEFRTQKLKLVAGSKSKETIYKENNAMLKLDVEKIYFSPRLSTERKRIFRQIKKNESILVMFSGNGVYPIVISKNTGARKIIGIEKNPLAHKYALENLKLNKIKNVELINGDVRIEVPKLNQKFDRIIMPLPKDADTFLDCVLRVGKKNTIVHLYGFSHRNELNETAGIVKEFCKKNKINCKILRTVKCGQYSPCKYRVCVDFILNA